MKVTELPKKLLNRKFIENKEQEIGLTYARVSHYCRLPPNKLAFCVKPE